MADRKFRTANKGHLDSSARAKRYDIPGIIAGIGLGSGMTIADIGAGTGFFSVPFSRAVGPGGKVLAIDINREMLDTIGAKVSELAITNIELVHSIEEKIPVPDSVVDIIFMSSVFHELEGDGTLLEARRMLRPGGALAVIDWRKVLGLDGPPLWHRLKESQVIERCTELGFTNTGNFQTGSRSQYGLLFRRK